MVRMVSSGTEAAMSAIRAGARGNSIDHAERILGRLDVQLEYDELSEILAEGVSGYLKRIEEAINAAAFAVQQSYFLH